MKIKIELDEEHQNKLSELRLYYKTNHGFNDKTTDRALMDYIIDIHHKNVKDTILYKARVKKI